MLQCTKRGLRKFCGNDSEVPGPVSIGSLFAERWLSYRFPKGDSSWFVAQRSLTLLSPDVLTVAQK
jgi:hypothetical protein